MDGLALEFLNKLGTKLEALISTDSFSTAFAAIRAMESVLSDDEFKAIVRNVLDYGSFKRKAENCYMGKTQSTR